LTGLAVRGATGRCCARADRALRGLKIARQRCDLVALCLQGSPQLCRRCFSGLSDLSCFVACFARECYFRLEVAACRCKFVRQRAAARAFFIERLSVPVCAGRQRLSCNVKFLRESGSPFALLAERLCCGGGFRLQLEIGLFDGATGFSEVLRKDPLILLVL